MIRAPEHHEDLPQQRACQRIFERELAALSAALKTLDQNRSVMTELAVLALVGSLPAAERHAVLSDVNDLFAARSVH